MVSASFPESTRYLGRPHGMTDEQCDPLSIADGKTPDGLPFVISCWKLTKDELDEFNRTGRVWLMVCGQTMPPVCLTAINPFSDADFVEPNNV